jgi:hypothetical protein
MAKKFNMYIIGGIVLTAVLADPDPNPDPDPSDPRVFGPPGSGSISQRWIWIRIWILLTLSKNSNKTLDFSCFVTFFTEFCVITMSRHRNYELTSIATS